MELEEKLLNQRMETAERMDIAKEERAQARALKQVDPDQTQMIQRGDTWIEVQRNVNGDVLNERPADQMKIQDLQRKRQLEDISIEAKLRQGKVADVQLALAEDKYENRDEDRALSIEERTAKIGQAERANRPKAALAPTSDAGVAQLLVKEYPDLVKELTTAEKGKTPITSADVVHRYALEAVKAAKAEANKSGKNIDARVVFQQALRTLKRNLSAAKSRKSATPDSVKRIQPKR